MWKQLSYCSTCNWNINGQTVSTQKGVQGWHCFNALVPTSNHWNRFSPTSTCLIYSQWARLPCPQRHVHHCLDCLNLPKFLSLCVLCRMKRSKQQNQHKLPGAVSPYMLLVQYPRGVRGPFSPVPLFFPVKYGVEGPQRPRMQAWLSCAAPCAQGLSRDSPLAGSGGGGIISGKENKTFFGWSWGKREAGEGEPCSYFLRSQ